MPFQDPSSQQYYPSPTGPGYGSTGTDRAQLEPLPNVRSDTLPRATLQGTDQVRYPEDKSMGELFKGVGDVVSSVTKATDTVIKDQLTDKLYKGIDAIRGEFGVDEAAQIAQSGQVLPSGKAADMADPPLAVKKLGNQVQGLQDKYESGGLAASYYSAKLESFVRSVREQHPGYRKEIDEEVQRITGQTPANATVTALRHDVEELNKKMQAKVTEYQKFLVTNAGYLPPNWQQMEQAEVHKSVIDNKGFEHKQDEARKPLLSIEDPTGRVMTPSQRQETGTQAFGVVADNVVQKYFKDGIEGIKFTPQNLQNMILEQKKPGAKKWTPDELGQVMGQLDLYEKTLTSAIRQEGLRPHMPGRPFNLRSDINDDKKFQTVIDGALAPIKEMKQSIADQQFGTLAVETAIMNNKIDNRMSELLTHRDIVTIAAGKKVMGPEVLNLWMSLQSAQGKTPLSGIATALNGSRAATSATVPDGAVPLAEELERRAGDGKNKRPVAVSPTELRTLMNQELAPADHPELVKVMKPEHRVNSLLNTFTKFDTLFEKGLIKVDSYETVTKRMLSPVVTKGVFELNDPRLNEVYKDQAFKMFKSTYFDQVGEVNSIVRSKNYEVSWSDTGTPLVVKMDSKKFPDAGESMEAGRTIKRINEGLVLMQPIWKASGISPEDGLKALGIDLKRPEEAPSAPSSPRDANPLKGGERKPKKTSQLDFAEPLTAVPLTASQNNLPSDFRPQPQKKSTNISDSPQLGISIDDIPEGMSARDFMKYLERRP